MVATATKPSRPKGPSPKSAAPSRKADAKIASSLETSPKRGRLPIGEKIGIYGPGGIGKTELVAGLDDLGYSVLFIDLDVGTAGLDVTRAMIGDSLVATYEEVRAAIGSQAATTFDFVVIDTFTALEEITRQWVIENVPHEKRERRIERIEDYGFGKGYVHIFEAALRILQDLDRLTRKQVNVVLICHQCAEKTPSAESEDYLEYQPRLQSPSKAGKLRERVFEWCNHFFRIDHDRCVEDGKAAEGDVRSIRTTRTATAWAKHRTMANGRDLPDVVAYPKGSIELWEIMFGQKK